MDSKNKMIIIVVSDNDTTINSVIKPNLYYGGIDSFVHDCEIIFNELPNKIINWIIYVDDEYIFIRCKNQNMDIMKGFDLNDAIDVDKLKSTYSSLFPIIKNECMSKSIDFTILAEL